MDKINIYLGGDPLYNDDILFLQDSIREAFKGMLAGISNTDGDSFILQGCVISYDGITYNITAGWICFKGEICKVDAHTVTAPNFWNLLVTYDADGNQVYDDATIHDTQEVRKVKMYTTDTGAAVASAAMLRIESKLTTLLATANAWTTTLTFEATFGNYGVPYANLAYRLNPLTGKVEFRGHIKKAPGVSVTADTKLFTITVPAFYPAYQQEIAGVSLGADFDAGRPVTIIVKTDGTVWVKASATNSNDTGNISFDGLSYSL